MLDSLIRGMEECHQHNWSRRPRADTCGETSTPTSYDTARDDVCYDWRDVSLAHCPGRELLKFNDESWIIGRVTDVNCTPLPPPPPTSWLVHVILPLSRRLWVGRHVWVWTGRTVKQQSRSTSDRSWITYWTDITIYIYIYTRMAQAAYHSGYVRHDNKIPWMCNGEGVNCSFIVFCLSRVICHLSLCLVCFCLFVSVCFVCLNSMLSLRRDELIGVILYSLETLSPAFH